MPFSGFARFANGFRFSSRRPTGHAIYNAFKASHGENFEEDGPAGARWWANAMAIARARSTLERAKNQAEPLKCWDLLRAHERHYSIPVPTNSSLWSRRMALSAKYGLLLGPIRSNIEYQLTAALGDDFVAWVTTPGSEENFGTAEPEGTSSPVMPWEQVVNVLNPDPQGIFGQPAVWMRILITSSVHTLGSRTVSWSSIGETQTLAIGTRLVVDPYKHGSRELVTVTGRGGGVFTATFRKSHDDNTEALTLPFPLWQGRSKHSLVVVPNGRAMVPEVRQKANEVMRKIIGGTSTWDVVEESTTPGECIGFVPGVGAPGITPIEEIEF